MILYGRNLSPYVRQIAVWCALQQRPLERQQITVAGADFETLKSLNPLGRVPTLILDDGTRMIECWTICDWLNETAPGGLKLFPDHGVERRDVLQRIAMAEGATDKAVSLMYDKNRRPAEYHFTAWIERLIAQVQGGLGEVEQALSGDWPSEPNAADTFAAIAYQFVEVTNPDLLEGRFPRLKAFSDASLALPIMAETLPPKT